MNRSSQRLTKKQAEQKARRAMTSVHVLIAVVAIIECVLLTVFTTFSWIESNSSLVIQNGPESSQIADQTTTKKMDIDHQLKSVINLNYTSSDFAPLNDFFSEVKYFEFAKATSSDGRTLFFPCRNNTYSEAGKYRKGDTIDYNTSYLYFDFIMSNRSEDAEGHTTNGANVENRDVYFDDTAGYTDIFSVSGDNLTSQQKTALEGAMRMSVTTQVGTGTPATKIYAKTAYTGTTAYNANSGTGSYMSIAEIPAAQSYAYDESYTPSDATDNNRNAWVETKQLSKSVYHTTNNVIDADKLFVVKKNAETKVSFRIWFDVWDPVFRTEFGLDNANFDFNDTTNAYSKIPDATVGIKFRLKTSGNDLRSIYFDDYTLSNLADVNNSIRHLTDENQNYSVWFYTYQPYVAASLEHPERTPGYYKIKLERDVSDSTHTLWTANTATASEMDYLMNQGGYSNASGVSNANNRYQKSYFCYGDYNNNNAIYRWELPAAPGSEDFIFNAYSYMPNSNYSPASSANGWIDCSKASGTTIRSGVGIWQDDASSTMTLLKFEDKATAVTSAAYNGGTNYQIMNAAAAPITNTHTQHQYLVFANNYNNATLSNNFTDTVAKRTAAMYYDTNLNVFKSYVPTGWLTGNSGVSFTYCPGGVFSANGATLRWYNSSPQARSGEYIYTALGYSNHYNNNSLGGISYTASAFSGSDGFLKGVGTWREVEQIKFCTELIDADLSGNYRYFVGISESGNYSQGYYAMIPDETHMTFSAYIPYEQGKTSPGVNFVRMSTVKTTSTNNSTGPTAYWYGNTRGTYSTYYPVSIVGTAASPAVYTRGYWNLSVLVDGTYENLIYDTLTDGTGSAYNPVVTAVDSNNDNVDYSPRDNYGLLEYSFDGQNWTILANDTSNTLNNSIDRYRFYIPAEGYTTVYWRWTPYAAYTITFKTDGVSKTVTAADTVFDYVHNVTDAAATGIYLVVTEAPYIPSQ